MLKISITTAGALKVATLIGDNESELDTKATDLSLDEKQHNAAGVPFYFLSRAKTADAVSDGIGFADDNDLATITAAYA